jgi:hypothetical protein
VRTVQADVFLPPKAPEIGDLSLSNFDVLVGKTPYTVESARRAIDVEKVVVFDIFSIQPPSVDCFLDQIRSYVLGLRPGEIEVFVSTRFGSGSYWFTDGLHRYELYDLAPNTKANCDGPEEGKKPWNRTGFEDLPGILGALWRKQGPIELVWVGQGFAWANKRVELGRNGTDPGPNVAAEWMPYITRLGLTLFPMVWGKESPGGLRNEASRVRDAGQVASYLGGDVNECRGGVTSCLDRVFEKNSHGWVVSVSGPGVKELNFGFWPLLKVQYGRDDQREKATLARPFAVPANRSDVFPNAYPATTPLFSTGLDAIPGCSSQPGKRAITVLIPRNVIARGGRLLKAYTTVLGNSKTDSTQKGFNIREPVDVIFNE